MTSGARDELDAAHTALRVATNRVVSALLDREEDAALVADIRAARAFQTRSPAGDAEGLCTAAARLDRVAVLLGQRHRVDVAAELGHPAPVRVDEVVEYDTMREAASRLAGWLAADAGSDDEAVRGVRAVCDEMRAVDIADADADGILLAREQFAKRLRDLEGPAADADAEQFLASEALAAVRQTVGHLIAAVGETMTADIAGEGDRHARPPGRGLKPPPPRSSSSA